MDILKEQEIDKSNQEFCRTIEAALKEEMPNIQSVCYNKKTTSKGIHTEIDVIFLFNKRKESIKSVSAVGTYHIHEGENQVIKILLRQITKKIESLTSALSDKELERIESVIDWKEAA